MVCRSLYGYFWKVFWKSWFINCLVNLTIYFTLTCESPIRLDVNVNVNVTKFGTHSPKHKSTFWTSLNWGGLQTSIWEKVQGFTSSVQYAKDDSNRRHITEDWQFSTNYTMVQMMQVNEKKHKARMKFHYK